MILVPTLCTFTWFGVFPFLLIGPWKLACAASLQGPVWKFAVAFISKADSVMPADRRAAFLQRFLREAWFPPLLSWVCLSLLIVSIVVFMCPVVPYLFLGRPSGVAYDPKAHNGASVFHDWLMGKWGRAFSNFQCMAWVLRYESFQNRNHRNPNVA